MAEDSRSIDLGLSVGILHVGMDWLEQQPSSPKLLVLESCQRFKNNYLGIEEVTAFV